MKHLEDQSESGKTFFVPGDIVGGQYEILKLLGRGTSGTVYKARDHTIGTTVALKLIAGAVREKENAAQRLHHEIRIAYSVKSDYVTNLYSCFTNDSHIGLVLEYVDGTSLYDLNRSQQKFSYQEITNIGRQIALGLQAIHDAGIIHRDLKLENILLDKSGIAKITDFGVSLVQPPLCDEDGTSIITDDTETRNKRATQAGKVVGTIHYLAPEYLAANQIDERSDIYAIGIVLYELVTGKFPYDYDTPMRLVEKKVTSDPIAPKNLRSDCPPWLNSLIMKCMDRNPDWRYQSATQLYDEFAAQIYGDSQPLLTENGQVAQMPKRRSQALLIAEEQKKASFTRWVIGSTVAAGIFAALYYSGYAEHVYYQYLYHHLHG
jgi:serine/threonine-protein kinase